MRTTIIALLLSWVVGIPLVVGTLLIFVRLRTRADLREIGRLSELNNVNLPSNWMHETNKKWRELTLDWLRQVDAERRRSEH